MLPFSAIRHALREDHLVDYIEQLHGAPTASPTPYYSHCQAESEAHTLALRARYALGEISPLLQDAGRRLQVHVDAVVGADTVRELTGGECSLPDGSYPILIRNTRLQLLADGVTLSNAKTTVAVKAQLAVACAALAVTTGLVLGKADAWALVDISGPDRASVAVADRAAEWAHAVRASHGEMSMDPPSRPELYPNMRVDTDNPLARKIKNDLAVKNAEITMVRGLSTAHRARALQQGIVSWRDPRLNARVLQLRSKPAVRVVDAILVANRAADPNVDRAKVASSCEPGDVFIDIETLGAMHAELPDMVFMIGIGYADNQFECFVANEATFEEERRVVDALLLRLTELGAKRLMHWAPYEVKVFRKLEERHGISIIQTRHWVDMCAALEASGYCPKHAFSYSLKSIAPAMHRLGMIDTIWDSQCTDGLTAMFNAFTAYRTGELAVLRDIEQYNRVDVLTTLEIWRYLHSIGLII